MRSLLIFLCVVITTAHAVSMFSLMVDEWEAFKLQHKKNYSSAVEDKFRMKIFLENRHKIAVHNKLFAKGVHKFEVAMNHFGDMLHHEFVNVMNGFKRNYNKTERLGATFLEPANVELPTKVDWRDDGAVTPVKNQGQCGSCWAFSTTGSLEGQHYRKTKRLVSLSEQNLVDCSEKFGNNGCNGGLMDNAFQYVKANGGIDTEKAYPYEGMDDSCRYSPQYSGATDKGFVDVESGNEDKLKAAVATVGPVSVAIDASHESFQFYKKGVYYEAECSSEALDHGVLVIGYGTDDDGDYWLVKNSWGEDWGLEGYIKMARNKDNNCGIATQASYPLV